MTAEKFEKNDIFTLESENILFSGVLPRKSWCTKYLKTFFSFVMQNGSLLV